MFNFLRYYWSAAKGYRLTPWKSPYLRWRFETFLGPEAAEMDARAHLSQGPRRTQFKADMNANGLKQALKNRDEPFGDGMVRIHWTRAEGEG